MRFQTLNQWLRWQESLHPKEIELGLERIASVWRKIYPVEALPFRVITVAGTNGKGSSVAFLDAILRAAGYCVGCFTSPHLVRYNERICLDGKAVDDHQICRAFDRIDQARGTTSITFFEFSALAALTIFCDAKPDVVVLEVGLGGRLDAVNIIDCDLALITTIGLDHTDWLGNTLDEIGWEKAGIMRRGKPVVYASPSAPKSLLAHAQRLQAPAHIAGVDYSFTKTGASWDWWSPQKRLEKLPLPRMKGNYQLQNAAAAIMTLTLMRSWLPLSRTAIEQGLQTTEVRGRFQLVPGMPTIVLDVAHNVEAVEVLAENLKQIPHSGKIRAVFGMMADKDIKSVVAITVALVDKWYLADLGVSRAMPTGLLSDNLAAAGVDGVDIEQYTGAASAFDGATADAHHDDLILVFGSFLLVGDILALIYPTV